MKLAVISILCLQSLVLQVQADEIDPLTLGLIKSVLKDPNNVRTFIKAALKNPSMIQDMSSMTGSGKSYGAEAYIKAAWEIMQDPEAMQSIMQGGWGAFGDMARRPVQSALEIVNGFTGLILQNGFKKGRRSAI